MRIQYNYLTSDGVLGNYISEYCKNKETGNIEKYFISLLIIKEFSQDEFFYLCDFIHHSPEMERTFKLSSMILSIRKIINNE